MVFHSATSSLRRRLVRCSCMRHRGGKRRDDRSGDFRCGPGPMGCLRMDWATDPTLPRYGEDALTLAPPQPLRSSVTYHYIREQCTHIPSLTMVVYLHNRRPHQQRASGTQIHPSIHLLSIPLHFKHDRKRLLKHTLLPRRTWSPSRILSSEEPPASSGPVLNSSSFPSELPFVVFISNSLLCGSIDGLDQSHRTPDP